MKFAIVGHSYVRHLQQVFPTHLTVDEVDFECSFFGYSGAKFRTRNLGTKGRDVVRSWIPATTLGISE